MVLHWTVLPLGHMISKPVSSNQIAVMQAPLPVAVVMMRDVSTVVWQQVVVMVKDGVEAVGMVTVGAAVGPPGLHLSVVMDIVILLLLRWHVRIGQLVVSVQEGFAVSTCDGTDCGVQPRAGRGGRGRGGALTGGRGRRRG